MRSITVEPIGWLVDNYLWTWTLTDRRVDGWWLMSSIKPILTLLVLYFTVVIYGPKWMLHRQSFNFKGILFVYSLSIAILSLYILTELSVLSYQLGYNWLCEPVRISTEPEEMRIVVALHWYLMSKVIELLDTVFIIVRKKNKQLTFLHVYHHSTMLFFSWIGMRWLPGGSATMAAIVNSFVHVVMYSYYALSTLGPSVAKYLRWKRYITLLQLAQFTLGLTLGINGFIIDCPFPKWMHYTNFFYMISYLVLFGRFYIRAYFVDKKTHKNNISVGNLKDKLSKRSSWEQNGIHYRGVD